MNLHQIQLSYQIEEDRVLLRVSFKNDKEDLLEIRAWLTRRFIRRLWSGMLDAMKTQVALARPAAAHASAEIVGMGHGASVSEIREAGGFDALFEGAAEEFPLGEAAILITTAHFSVDADQPVRINFISMEGGSFEVVFTEIMLHGFCSLLQDAIKRAEWDMELILPGSAADPPGPRLLN
jgi:hypothetical protein